MKAEEGVQESKRVREDKCIHWVGRKLNGWRESQHEIHFQREQTNIYLSIYRCASVVPLISFFVGIKEEEGERKEEMRTIYNTGDGGRLTEGI